ncbi:DUF305 domain-containing protein [Microbacterium sp. SLBN-146]|uniref:DUF305 domain-containing protein n=1 Tax=Microbacterium sp. SLBN-146 TaxID=2768457 RepID=UPI001151F42F|nr:DUF305 domain-containing protein [Microbacterium sp. SLBN-146]TQJ31232.1 uncharacterized protein (DUF305 family) [Microbacterium sp. SLBN-146]
MRSRIAVIGVVVAALTLAGGAGAIVVAGSTDVPSQPVAAATAGGAAATAFPSIEDHCYIEGMIPHHEQALVLSESVLAADGVRERTRALADFIIGDQSAEIGTMRAWQQAWAKAIPTDATASSGHAAHDAPAGTIPTGCGGHAHGEMKGMASPEQLAALAAADGAEADRLFLELMIVHHEGALDMATSAVTNGSNAFVRSSAKHVLVEQEREITAMTSLVAELP